MEIIDLEPGDPRLAAEILPVLRELRPHLTEQLFEEVYGEGYVQGLRFSAAYEDGGACVGVAGWRVIVSTSGLRTLYVDDLVTAQNARSGGVGHALLAYAEERGRALGCRALRLDSGTQRTAAHRFYLRERMDIVAFTFLKPLDQPRRRSAAPPPSP